MSELINTGHKRTNFHSCLLSSVSAATLITSVCVSGVAAAESAGRPSVWVELGGQLENSSEGQQPFEPPFAANMPDKFFSLVDAQKPARYSFGSEAKVSVEPIGSEWGFSVSLRYGRSNANRQRHQQTPNTKISLDHVTVYNKYIARGSYYPNQHVKFADATVENSQSQSVLDFMVGRDVGLGIFGRQTQSVFSAGIRFAQFSSRNNVAVHAEPDVQYPAGPLHSKYAWRAFKSSSLIHFHDYALAADDQRSFRGIGPSVEWSSSVPIAGNPDSSEITFDWAANFAVLFGRQKASGQHQTAVHTYNRSKWHKTGGCAQTSVCLKSGHFTNPAAQDPAYATGVVAHHTNTAAFNRMRSVAVPNLGGFAGISYRYSNAKVSFGYRADFFFGAMDEGIDARRIEDIGFHGPFATISIGLGG